MVSHTHPPNTRPIVSVPSTTQPLNSTHPALAVATSEAVGFSHSGSAAACTRQRGVSGGGTGYIPEARDNAGAGCIRAQQVGQHAQQLVTQDPRVQDAFDRTATAGASGLGGLETRGLREALRVVGIETSVSEAIAFMQKYDARGAGWLNLDEFGRLVAEFKAFDATADDSAFRAPLRTPSTHAHYKAHGGSPLEGRDGPEMPLALSEAEAKQLKPPPKADVPLMDAPGTPPPPPDPHLQEILARPHGKGLRRGRWSSRPLGDGRNVVEKGKEDARQKRSVYCQLAASGAAVEVESDAGVLKLLAEHAGGKMLQPSQQWVVRSMRALELRYQTAAREEAMQRFNLEVHANRLAHDLSMCQEALRKSDTAKSKAQADAARASEGLRQEQEMCEAMRQHTQALAREREALRAELQRCEGDNVTLRREAEELQSRWQQAANEAGEWAQRAYEAQAASRQALAEANEARQAVEAVERSILNAQEYRLKEEAGYQIQSIVQLVPTKATHTAVYEQPMGVESWVPV
jgi:hypothetical protein